MVHRKRNTFGIVQVVQPGGVYYLAMCRRLRLITIGQKMEFKQMRARLAKIPEAGEYLAYFPVSGIEYNAAIAA